MFCLWQSGEEMVTDDCSQKCTCDAASRSMQCVALKCDDNAHCAVQDGENVCQCDEGFEGDGFKCEGKC